MAPFFFRPVLYGSGFRLQLDFLLQLGSWLKLGSWLHPPSRPASQRLIGVLAALALLAVTLPGAGLLAQEITGRLTLSRRDPKPLLFAHSPQDGGLVTVGPLTRSSSRRIALRKYDRNFERSWRSLIYEQNGRLELAHLEVLGERILVFATEEERKTKHRLTYLYSYNLQGQLLAEALQIHRDPIPERNSSRFRFERSLDRAYLLAFKTFATGEDQQVMQYLQFHQDTAFITRGEITFPYADEDLRVKQVRMDSEGRIYVLARQLLAGKIREPADSRFLLFKHVPNTDTLVEMPLDFGDRYVSDLIFRPDRQHNLILGGFYSNRTTNRISGTLYARIDADHDSLEILGHEPLDRKVLARYLSERQLMKGRELQDFFLDDLILRSDGGAVMLAEQFYITNTTYTDINGMWFSREIYNYDDILVISISPEGETEWSSVVMKEQAAEAPRELSYVKLVGPDRILFFYKSFLRKEGVNVYTNEVLYNGEVGPARPYFKRYTIRDVFYRGLCRQITNTSALLAWKQARNNSFTIARVQF